MKYFPYLLLSLAALAVVHSAQATGLMTCESGDPSTWQSAEQLTSKITGEGWEVRRVKVDGGCYEVYGTTPRGERGEAYFHPVSLELLLIARRGEILYRKE